MGGPIPNFVPGKSASSASAIRCAEECHNVDLPSASFIVSSTSFASSLIGRVASHTSPFTLAASTFLAKPSEMDCAICSAVVPFAYSRTEPSGRVILIIFFFLSKHPHKRTQELGLQI